MSKRDAAEQAQLLRLTLLLGGPVLVMGGFAIPFICWRFHLPTSVLVAGYILLVPSVVMLILLVERFTSVSAHGLITTLHAGNQEHPRTGFSQQEALVARGRIEDAATSYRLHLAGEPEDVSAWVALGRLLAGPLADPAAAAEAYQQARKVDAAGEWERVITTDLIDLYERTLQGGKLQSELARFADLYRGTKAGDAARARLHGMKHQVG